MEGNVTQRDPYSREFASTGKEQKRFLVLHNDEVNTFEHVIQSLILICGHDSWQAEQCTLITHHKGKCEIKSGELTILAPMKEGLEERGLQVTID
ncbi:MAG: ATP-dependent Clp protease adaptor ClpS [Bacteroidales bacterium]|jgi:ATP-dependent Clp protease adaptor protein ClpS|nr:ATP-dependent Clp protease adaptor ClpS [Bacteroidales bacterium]MDD2570049.1 ATP-dependent Clp protease adaptor ClpS [Bacteroidales bacterium]MDD2812229.1 ATP-dependent Clp protease adaptor ClpS [Bacteroidales bacterium]MDD3385259.1 ATP-dependent Clp protease adaptor ClpS [Bacteroidales bacterium]MDD3811099.1 ATP-dependent Clp protease adaptor ClpS [Bacteroidales bacterium]